MNTQKILIPLILLTLVASLASAQDWNSVEVDGFLMNWRVQGENLDVRVSTATEGWVAVGFDPTDKMKDANILIGYVDDQGDVEIFDHYGNGLFSHRDDERLGGSVDITNIAGSQQNGRTELSFTIPLDSGDDTDRPLIPGNVYKVIFASHTRDRITMKHNRRTSVEITL